MHECAVGQDTQNSWPVGTRGFGLGVIDHPPGALAGAAEAPIRMIAAAATAAAAATRRAMHGSIPDGRGWCFPAGLIGCCREGVTSPPFPELIPRMMAPRCAESDAGSPTPRTSQKAHIAGQDAFPPAAGTPPAATSSAVTAARGTAST